VTPTPNTCKRCRAKITLLPSGKYYKWFDAQGSWRCGSDDNFPVRSHAPATKEDLEPLIDAGIDAVYETLGVERDDVSGEYPGGDREYPDPYNDDPPSWAEG
jgi:hypothetical protein